MKPWITIVFIVILAAYPFKSMAHGVRGEVASGGVVVKAEYTTGDPMSYAKVEITAPDKKIPFQIGRTDRNGRFCFFPDTIGKWQVVVSDGMGHRLEVAVPVNESMELKTDQRHMGGAGGSLSNFEKALMGISIIFGIFGFFFWWAGKKRR